MNSVLIFAVMIFSLNVFADSLVNLKMDRCGQKAVAIAKSLDQINRTNLANQPLSMKKKKVYSDALMTSEKINIYTFGDSRSNKILAITFKVSRTYCQFLSAQQYFQE
jgi:hypothetical protein